MILEPDVKGLFVAADLSRTDLARGLYQDISAGMITKMSWAFTVAEESYDRETHTRTILKIKKVYDVSAVSIPANNDTEISARAFASRSYERERQELLKRRAAILKIKASLNKNGFAVKPEESARTVFCNKKSVGYSEYFKSQQTGKLVEAKYEVHKADYGGEDVVEVNGRRYFVLKTYDTGTDTIELTLTDLRHRNEV